MTEQIHKMVLLVILGAGLAFCLYKLFILDGWCASVLCIIGGMVMFVLMWLFPESGSACDSDWW